MACKTDRSGIRSYRTVVCFCIGVRRREMPPKAQVAEMLLKAQVAEMFSVGAGEYQFAAFDAAVTALGVL